MTNKEKQTKEQRQHTIIGWATLGIVFVVSVLVFWGPCDPVSEPMPASHGGSTTHIPVTDLQSLPDNSHAALDTSGGCSTSTTSK